LDGGISTWKGNYLHRPTKTEKRRYISVTQAGFESMIPIFRLERAFCNLDGMTTLLDACREYSINEI
jgi:hypothetical protein